MRYDRATIMICVERALEALYRPLVTKDGSVKKRDRKPVYLDFDLADFSVTYLGEKSIVLNRWRHGEITDSRLWILAERFAARMERGLSLDQIAVLASRDKFTSAAESATISFRRHGRAPDGGSLSGYLEGLERRFGATCPIAFEVAKFWEDEYLADLTF